MAQNLAASSSLPPPEGSAHFAPQAEFARIVSEIFDARQLPPATASGNATELQYFAMGLQTALRMLSHPADRTTDTLQDGDSERIIAPDSVEGAMLAKEGKTAHDVTNVNVCTGFFDDEKWSLTSESRQKLYAALFLRLGDYDYLALWYAEAVPANVLLLKQLESFILHASKARNDISPALETFVEDVTTFIYILNTPYSSSSTTTELDSPLVSMPRFRFWDSRLASWHERWAGSLDAEPVLAEYVEGLCDAVFGLWQKPNKASSFHEGPSNYQCADHVFTALNSGRSDYLKVIRDHRVFDAAYVETCGPFRFKRTNRLDRHLTVQGHDILFFTDWRKWVGLCYHSVLQTEQANTGFEVMANSRLGRVRTNRRIARATGSIAISLLLMQYLCFYGEALGYDSNIQARKPRKYFIFSLNRGHRSPELRRSIAARLDIDLSLLDRLKEVANDRQHDEWGLALHLEPFDERASRLVETLSNWKPETFWEMRYPGYGAVDPIGRYGFHFAIGLGVITILGFALGIAQTYAQFRQTW
jgi:hypothetical protein